MEVYVDDMIAESWAPAWISESQSKRGNKLEEYPVLAMAWSLQQKPFERMHQATSERTSKATLSAAFHKLFNG